MPLIPIPRDDDEMMPIVYMTEGSTDFKKIKEMMDRPKWKCRACGLTNHGLNQHCADWRCRTGRGE